MYQWSRSAPWGKIKLRFFLHFVYITKSVFSLTSYHIFVHFNHYAAFYSDNKLCAQRFIEFTGEKLNPKGQLKSRRSLFIS